MKKIVIICLLQIHLHVTAQQKTWLDIGIKGGYGITLLTNGNVWNDKNIEHNLSTGYCFGGKLGINFNESHELTIDVISSALSQDYKIKTKDSIPIDYNKTIRINTLNFLLLYRHHAENGSYAEIGPQLSLIQQATEKSSATTNYTTSIKNYYTPNYFAGVFGFGGSILGTNNTTLLLGCRFTYAFSDIISKTGGAGENSSYPFNDGTYTTNYKSYKALKPFTAMLVMELNFDLGYFAKSSCKRGRHKFLLF